MTLQNRRKHSLPGSLKILLDTQQPWALVVFREGLGEINCDLGSPQAWLRLGKKDNCFGKTNKFPCMSNGASAYLLHRIHSSGESC